MEYLVDPVTVYLNVVNVPTRLWQSGRGQGAEDHPITIDVVANDSDGDGD